MLSSPIGLVSQLPLLARFEIVAAADGIFTRPFGGVRRLAEAAAGGSLRTTATRWLPFAALAADVRIALHGLHERVGIVAQLTCALEEGWG